MNFKTTKTFIRKGINKTYKQVFAKDAEKIAFYFIYDNISEVINELPNTYKDIPFKSIKRLKKFFSKKKSPNIPHTRIGLFISNNSLFFSLDDFHAVFPGIKKKEIKIGEKKVLLILNRKNRENTNIKKTKEIIFVEIKSNEIDEIKFLDFDLKKHLRDNDNYDKNTLYNVLFTNNDTRISNIYSKNLIYSIFPEEILKQIIIDKLNLNSIKFISPIKSNLSSVQKSLISKVKSLEYKEYFSRMKEKINKIKDIALKIEVTKALTDSSKETCLYKLKKLFLRKMCKYLSIAKEIINHANKYKVHYYYYNSYKIPQGSYNQSMLLSFSKERAIPKYIQDFNISEPHMIPTAQYLDVRISRTIRILISKVNEHGRNTEIFIGSENQMLLFYSNSGLELIANLKTNSSLKYYLFANGENPNLKKIVILGVGNETKLNHLLLQLKLSKVDLNKVVIRGNIEDALYENQQKLKDIIENLQGKIDTVFMGNRSLILVEFAKRKYPKEMKSALNETDAEKIAEKLLQKNHKLKTYIIGEGVYKFSYFEWQIRNKNVGIIGCRMPNGSLARIATEAFIKKGIRHFIMLGAGGSLSSLSPVGSYQLINTATHNNNSVSLSELLNVKKMKVEFSDIPLLENGNNVTLDSPLVETRSWLNKVRNAKLTSVDVETYHIIKGIQNCQKFGKKAKIEILAGLFISDVVGDCPLVEKIKSRNTWTHLPKFLNNCFDIIEKQVKESYDCSNIGTTYEIKHKL